MAYNRNARKTWTAQDIRLLRKLLADGTPINVVALRLGRSVGAVRKKKTEDDK